MVQPQMHLIVWVSVLLTLRQLSKKSCNTCAELSLFAGSGITEWRSAEDPTVYPGV